MPTVLAGNRALFARVRARRRFTRAGQHGRFFGLESISQEVKAPRLVHQTGVLWTASEGDPRGADNRAAVARNGIRFQPGPCDRDGDR